MTKINSEIAVRGAGLLKSVDLSAVGLPKGSAIVDGRVDGVFFPIECGGLYTGEYAIKVYCPCAKGSVRFAVNMTGCLHRLDESGTDEQFVKEVTEAVVNEWTQTKGLAA